MILEILESVVILTLLVVGFLPGLVLCAILGASGIMKFNEYERGITADHYFVMAMTGFWVLLAASSFGVVRLFTWFVS